MLKSVFALFLCFTALVDAYDETLPVPSTPEQIASLSIDRDLFADGLVSPLSGQLLLSKTDLVAQGAQSIYLDRIYHPPSIPCSFHKEKMEDLRLLHGYLQRNYVGWKFLPHLYLQIVKNKKGKSCVRVTLPNGITADYRIKGNGTTPLQDLPYGVTNVGGGVPGGQYDIRNVHISLEDNEKEARVKTPNGTLLIYRYLSNPRFLVLEKEILPNGKVLKYHYDQRQLPTCVESLDPKERFVYASLRISGSPWDEQCEFLSSSGQTVSYTYDTVHIQKTEKIKHGKMSVNVASPPVLYGVNSPYFRKEKVRYCDRFLLAEYESDEAAFHCSYGAVKHHKKDTARYRIDQLLLPRCQDDQFQPAYTFSYQPPIPGHKNGSSTVMHQDGSYTTYLFGTELRLKAIHRFDQHGKLGYAKRFQWRDCRLQSIQLTDHLNQVYWEKTFEYDSYGNPIKESFSGNLTGAGISETYTIHRKYSQDGFHNLLEERHPNGKKVIYTYLSGTNLLTSKLTKQGQHILKREQKTYDDCHNLVCHAIDDGSSSNLNDLSGVTERRITRYTLRQSAPFLHMPEAIEECYLEDSREKLLTKKKLHYDQNGNVIQKDIYDADGVYSHSTYATFNERRDLLTETNALGERTEYTYDGKGHCIRKINASKRLTVETVFDLAGRPKKQTESGNNIIHAQQFTYDAKNRLLSSTDPYDNTTFYTYDAITGKQTTKRSPPVLTPTKESAKVIEHQTYDPFGNLRNETDADGNITHYTYNAYNKPVTIAYPDGGTEQFIYFTDGLLKEHITQDGLTTTYTYDVLGRVLSKTFTDPNDKKIAHETFTYNAFHLTAFTDKAGHTTIYSYDGAGRKIAEDHAGHITNWKYNPLGQVAQISKLNGENTLLQHYIYDLLGRVIFEKQTDLSGTILHQVAYTYDTDGNKTAITQYINDTPSVETFTYDPFKRITQHRDALGNTTSTDYDESNMNALGQRILTKTTHNPKGISIAEMYDARGKLARKKTLNAINEIIALEEMFLSPAGYELEHHNHIYENTLYNRTAITKYTRNFRGQKTSMTRAAQTQDAKTTHYTYTPSGKLLQKTWPDKTSLNYTYDAFGFIEALTSSDHTIDHQFEYDSLGHLIKATDHNHSISITREIDPFGNVIKEAFPNYTISKQFDHFNRPLSVQLSTGKTIHYHYDSCHLRSVEYQGLKHKYSAYDLAGNLREEQIYHPHDTITYTLDDKGQTLHLASAYFKQECTYDSLGHLTSTITNEISTDYEYDDLSQLLSEHGSSSHHYPCDSNYNHIKETRVNHLDQPFSLTYDGKGNLTSNQHNTYTYDALNRLIQVITNQHKMLFTYDPLDRRLSKATYDLHKTGPPTIEHYLYDGTSEIGSLSNNHVKQFRALCPSQKNTLPKAAFVELHNNLYTPLHDVQGNVRHLINPSGIQATHDFTAFGTPVSKPNTIFNPWQYAAKRVDLETNLIYFGKRYYNPTLMRWLTEDPAGFANTHNLYAYVLNNPFHYVDPDGQVAIALFTIAWGAGTVITSPLWVPAAAATAATALLAYSAYKAVDYVDQRLQEKAWQDRMRKDKVYAPDKPLCTDENGRPLPETDAPHTQLGQREGSKGKYPQAREFDETGAPVRDIDFTDHGRSHEHPNPHQHRPIPNPTGGTPQRGPPEPVSGWND